MIVRTLRVGLCALVLTLGTSRVGADAQASWTLLFFLNADCTDGDSAVTPLLEQLMVVGSTDDVQVLVYIDRNETKCIMAQKDLPAQGTLCRVHKGTWEPVTGLPANANQAPNESNFGDAETLAWFVKTGVEYAPADKVALFTVGHGAPWRGLGADMTSADRLEFGEYSKGLATALKPLQKRLSLLGLIHCGAACMEAIVPLAPHAEWIVASEDVTTVFSIPPAELLNQLGGAAGLSAEWLARWCVDSYELSPDDGMGDSAGLALFDTRHAAAAVDALDQLSMTLTSLLTAQDPITWAELRFAKLNSMQLNCCSEQDCAAPACALCLCCMVDLLNVAQYLTGSVNPTVARQARCLVCRLQELVPHARMGGEFGTCGGVSVFLPCDLGDIKDYGQAALADPHRWGGLLDAFLQQPCQDCGDPEQAASATQYCTSSQAEVVQGKELHTSRSVTVTASTAAYAIWREEAWLTIRTDPKGPPRLTIPAKLVARGADLELSATWDWALPCLETHLPDVCIPLEVRYPRPRGTIANQWQAEVPLHWRRAGAADFTSRDVVATLVLTDVEGAEDAGWIRRVRDGRRNGLFTPVTLRQGDALVPRGAKLAKFGVPALDVPDDVTPLPMIASVPPRILRRRLATGDPVWFGFSILTADGLYREVRLPKPYAANAHPVTPVGAMFKPVIR